MRRRASLTSPRSLVRSLRRSSRLRGRTTVGCPRGTLTASRLGFGLYSPRGHLPGQRRQLVVGTRAGRWGIPQRCRDSQRCGLDGDESLPGDACTPGLGACRATRRPGLAVARHTAAVRLTDFWGRMRQHFGPAYAASFAHDFVMSELGGRTIDQALAQGVDVQEIWRAVCRTVEVAPKLR